MKSIFYLLLFCFTLSPAFAQQCKLHPPTNVQLTEVASCQVSIKWNKVPEAFNYQTRYKLKTDSKWTVFLTTDNDTFFTFTGLKANKKYDFGVRSICSDVTKSAYVKITATTLKCSLPTSLTSSMVSQTSEKLSWNGPCLNDSVFYRYKEGKPWLTWTTGLVVNSSSVTLTDLNPNSTYIFQISSCTDTSNNWTLPDTFKTGGKPNVLLVIVDDARYDFYSCNGAPSFFQTPSIDRIANEGVNFKNYFTVCAICAPSRACMASGLYPLKNGTTNNEGHLKPGTVTVPHILQQNDYYTAFLGKNDGIFLYPTGDFDYWMNSKNDDLEPVKFFDYNGTNISVPGLITEILTDSATAVITRAEQPFFMWLAYRIPHSPLVSAPEYVGMFDDETMPIGNDTAKYKLNYPSYLDKIKGNHLIGGDDLVQQYKELYEAIAELDSCIGRIIDAMESANKLDNTLIIFVSDNGHILGEHGLFLKRLAYDPSIRIPLFMRYPSWFNESSIVTDQIGLNIDIAPTILEAAGIEETYDMDGVSLNQLYRNQVTRNEMYYQYLYSTDAGFNDVPSIRAVRDLNYKYVYYGCKNDTTEEFFDLVNDPDEMVNLVNTQSYSSIIDDYRDKLASLKNTFDDNITEKKLDCFIKHPFTNKSADLFESAEGIQVYPNPSPGNITVTFPYDESYLLSITNSLGRLIYTESGSGTSTKINLSSQPTGLYFIKYRNQQTESVVKWLLNK